VEWTHARTFFFLNRRTHARPARVRTLYSACFAHCNGVDASAHIQTVRTQRCGRVRAGAPQRCGRVRARIQTVRTLRRVKPSQKKKGQENKSTLNSSIPCARFYSPSCLVFCARFLLFSSHYSRAARRNEMVQIIIYKRTKLSRDARPLRCIFYFLLLLSPTYITFYR
jgi:hypothetical protein